MIAVIATFNVKEGQESAFEAEFAALTARVRADEPGNSLFQLAKAKREPGVYKVLELYADKDAIKLHGGTDYFKAAFAKFRDMLNGDAVIEMLDTVG